MDDWRWRKVLHWLPQRLAQDLWTYETRNSKHLSPQQHGDDRIHPDFIICVQPGVGLMRLYFCSKGIPLDSPSVSRNGKCVQFYTSRSGGHFERTPSFAAFLALYFLTPNYVSGRTHCQQLQITGCLILLLRAAVRPHAQPSTATDGPDRCMSLANVPLLLREGRKNST